MQAMAIRSRLGPMPIRPSLKLSSGMDLEAYLRVSLYAYSPFTTKRRFHNVVLEAKRLYRRFDESASEFGSDAWL
jgi:hypothetical protein